MADLYLIPRCVASKYLTYEYWLTNNRVIHITIIWNIVIGFLQGDQGYMVAVYVCLNHDVGLWGKFMLLIRWNTQMQNWIFCRWLET